MNYAYYYLLFVCFIYGWNWNKIFIEPRDKWVGHYFDDKKNIHCWFLVPIIGLKFEK